MYCLGEVIITLVLILQAFGAGGTKNPSRQEGAILDFEGDVIEGDRKSLDFFIQGDAKDQNLDVILFDRKNFNSFHSVDRKYRPPSPSNQQGSSPRKGR